MVSQNAERSILNWHLRAPTYKVPWSTALHRTYGYSSRPAPFLHGSIHINLNLSCQLVCDNHRLRVDIRPTNQPRNRLHSLVRALMNRCASPPSLFFCRRFTRSCRKISIMRRKSCTQIRSKFVIIRIIKQWSILRARNQSADSMWAHFETVWGVQASPFLRLRRWNSAKMDRSMGVQKGNGMLTPRRINAVYKELVHKRCTPLYSMMFTEKGFLKKPFFKTCFKTHVSGEKTILTLKNSKLQNSKNSNLQNMSRLRFFFSFHVLIKIRICLLCDIS